MSSQDRTAAQGRFEVRKLSYSVRPWRIVEAVTGRELWTHEVFDHLNLGQSVIPAPMSYDRKREAVAALAELEETGLRVRGYT